MKPPKFLVAVVALLTIVSATTPADAFIFRAIAQARANRAANVQARMAAGYGVTAGYGRVATRVCGPNGCSTVYSYAPVRSRSVVYGSPPTVVASSGGSSGYSATYGVAPAAPSYGSTGGTATYAAPSQPAPQARQTQAVAECTCNGECNCPCCPCRGDSYADEFDLSFSVGGADADLAFSVGGDNGLAFTPAAQDDGPTLAMGD